MIFASDVDHLLLTQIVTQPDNAESISIYNPTNQIINLQNYYICDDEEYYLIQEGSITSSTISGYTTQFPSINIDAGDTMTIVFNENYKNFYGNEFIADLMLFGANENSLNGQIGGANAYIEFAFPDGFIGAGQTPGKMIPSQSAGRLILQNHLLL